MELLRLLDRPIAFQRSFVRIGAGVTGALLLSQLVYWTNRAENEEGWVYKTQEEWEEETGLSRYEQEGARKKLRSLGLLLERKQGLPAKLFYRVNIPVLYQLLGVTPLDAEFPHTSMGKTTKPVGGKPANNHTETTTDIPPNPQGGGEAKISFGDVVIAFNEILGDRLPTVQQLNDKRKRQIKKLLAELHEPTVEAVRAYFDAFAQSANPFYFGDNKRGWRASFDYLLRSDTLTKTREGAL